MLSVKQWLLIALLGVFIAMGVGLYWQHSIISSQSDTIALQKESLDKFEKDKKAQDASDKQLKASRDKAAKERDMYKGQLKDALKNNSCADVPFDDNTQRLLNELYGSQGAR